MLQQRNKNVSDSRLAYTQTLSPWMVSVLVLALLFLTVPTHSYWLVWITPILAAMAPYAKGMFVAWALLQSSFVLKLPSLHRELGVSLPAHIVQGFNIPNLSTALQVEHPFWSDIYEIILVGINGLMVCGLLLTIGTVIYQTWKSRAIRNEVPVGKPPVAPPKYTNATRARSRLPWSIPVTILLPIILLFVGLGLNLYVGRSLASQNRWQNWQPFELSANSSLSQDIVDNVDKINGVGVKLIESSSETFLTLCVYEGNVVEQNSAIDCTTANSADRILDGTLFFRFDNPIRTEDKQLSLQIQLNEPASKLTLEAAENEHFGLIKLGDRIVNGHANLAVLTPFNPRDVTHTLFVENILRDRELLIWLTSVLISVLIFISILVRQPSTLNEVQHS